MPVISTFFGIIIRMFYQDHEPPHFHANHQGDHAKYSFDGIVMAGGLRSKAAGRRVERWAALHRRELEANWAKMKASQPLERIEPLE
jgi:hypothetical protein